ncbi:zinc ABC transporter substrate-binding protein [Thiosulfatimonas sediminis]|uniref:High-affinity zinc uptake system protein ZnuA n=1 Tax=Thiosulfatimonas sediminis TaxID=2675054 RepID=A0A6F8PWN7_9GAMM|nr:zinc ABC transporter substrate-binding protein [Thiosulfatimonas sediminis]BBP46535.1 zinc ABC transporter substrate-binding protein [Thiosulfatimonas sediminis]
MKPLLKIARVWLQRAVFSPIYFFVFASSLFGFLLAAPVQALQITVTVPPLAGMIAPLLDQEDHIEVLLKPGVSPHGFQLKPSQLAVLQKTDLLLSVGTPVDAWVTKFAARIQAKQLRLADLTAVEKLPMRIGGIWEKSLGDKHAGHDHEHDDHSNPLSFDGHLWMSMSNARQLIMQTAQVLRVLKPHKAQQIALAQEQWLAQLQAQDEQNRARLQAVQDKAFLVLHDAFQYFEHQYGLNGVGSVRLNPDVPPSLKRIAELRERMIAGKVACIFQEPQFPSKPLQRLAAGTSAKLGILDPMGTLYIKQSAEPQEAYMLYDQFSEQLTAAFVACLGAAHE